MNAAKNIKNAIRLAIGAIMIVPALALIAFGPSGRTGAPPGRTVVTYWEKWTDFEGEAMRRLCGVFNETVGAEKGIYVDYNVTTQIELKTLVAAAGGDPPDLAGLWPDRVSAFASKGALQPLTERAAAAGINAETILPSYYNPCIYHDEMYCVPLTPWSVALYYNRDLFREVADELEAAGYSPEHAPRTIAELEDYCRILCVRNDRGEIERMGYIPGAPWPVGWYWLTWPLWFNGSYHDGPDGKFIVNAEKHVEAYTWVQSFAKEYGYKDIQTYESSLANFNSPDNPFMIGKLAMMQQGPWFANMIQQYAPDIDFGAAPFPTLDGSEVSFCGQDVLVIPAGAHHPDEAWAFIEWLYTSGPINVPSLKDEPQPGYEFYIEQTEAGPVRHPMPPLRPIEWICWIHYKNSPLISPSEEFIATHPNPVIDVHERMARSEQAQSEPQLANWSEVRSTWEATYSDIWGGRAEPRERLDECQHRIDVLSELARRRMERYGVPYP